MCVIVPRLTGEAEQRLKVPTLCDTRAVFGAGVPQVLKLPHGDDDAAGHGGDLPVVVGQRGSGDQPADDAHDEPGRFHSRRHDGSFFSEKPLRGNPTAADGPNEAFGRNL